MAVGDEGFIVVRHQKPPFSLTSANLLVGQFSTRSYHTVLDPETDSPHLLSNHIKPIYPLDITSNKNSSLGASVESDEKRTADDFHWLEQSARRPQHQLQLAPEICSKAQSHTGKESDHDTITLYW